MGVEEEANAAQQSQTETTADNIDALLEAARYDDLEDVISLASSGVSLNSKDSEGRTALHMAAANEHLGIVEYLIRNGVTSGSMEGRYHGTTTLAMVYDDGLIVAADTRSGRRDEELQEVKSIDDNTLKITKINSHMVLTIAGDVRNGNMIAKHLVEKYTTAKPGDVTPSQVAKEAYKFMKTIRNNHQCSLLLACFDHKTERDHEIYKVTLGEGAKRCSNVRDCSGSGSKHAEEILSEHFRLNMVLDYAVDLAAFAIYSASLIDTATGERALVFKITEEGVSKVCCKTCKEFPSIKS